MSEAAEFYAEAGVTPPHGMQMYGYTVLVKPKETSKVYTST
jgi:hypothetical protein